MDAKNNRGQILIELSIVMLLVFLVLIAALPQLAEQTKNYKKFQLTEKKNEKKSSRIFKK